MVIRSRIFASLLFFGVLRTIVGGAITQPSVWSGNGTDVGSSWTSQVDSTPAGFRTFDNFSFQSSTTVGQVTWLGIYLNLDGLTNGAKNTTTWDVGFFADNSGSPGSTVSDTSLSAAQVSTQAIGNGMFDGNTVTVYQFTATFTSFTAVAGTTYWFSPLSEASSFSPLFSWIQGTGGDNSSFQEQLGGIDTVTAAQAAIIHTSINPTFVRPGDRAFTVGAPVPEPSGFILIGLGLAGLAILRRR
jgi:hypothetical protein